MNCQAQQPVYGLCSVRALRIGLTYQVTLRFVLFFFSASSKEHLKFKEHLICPGNPFCRKFC